MSASIAQIPMLANPPPDPLGVQARMIALQTAQQQAQQSRIATQQAQLGLARQQYGLSQVPGFAAFMPPGSLPAMSGGGANLPQPSGSTGTGGTTDGSGQPAPSDPLSGPDRSNSMYGVPLPGLQAVSVFSSQNPDAALKAAMEGRRQRLYELAQSLPWNQAIGTAYQEGYLDQRTAQTLLPHADKRAQFIQALESPDSYASLVGSGIRAGVQPDGQGGWEGAPAVAASRGAQGYAERQGNLAAEAGTPLPPSAGGAAPGPRAASLVDGTATLSGDDWATQVEQAENATGNPAATNPGSSATGNGQFIDQTWRDLIKRNRPELAAGRTDAQVLALRTDPTLVHQMMMAYGQQNVGALQQQNLPVNATTLAMAHRFGPGDVATVLNAPANTPLRTILSPHVMQANKDLMNKTAGQVAQQMRGQFGLAPVQFGAPDGAGAGGPPPPAPAVPGAGASAAPAVPGAAAGVPAAGGVPVPSALSPQGLPSAAGVAAQTEAARQNVRLQTEPAIAGSTEAARQNVRLQTEPAIAGSTEAATAPIAVSAKQIDEDHAIADEAQAAADKAIAGKTQILQMRDTAANLTTGSFGELRAGLANLFTTLGGEFGKDTAKTILGMDPAQAQEFSKYALLSAGEIENHNSPRGGYKITELYSSALPGLNTRPDAIKYMTNLIAVGHQLETDANQGATQSYADQQVAFKANPRAGYTPMAQYYKNFNDQYPSIVGIAAAKVLSGDPSESWAKGLSEPQKRLVFQLAWRTDPTAQLNINGKLWNNPASNPEYNPQ